jgi:hypothetical protein
MFTSTGRRHPFAGNDGRLDILVANELLMSRTDSGEDAPTPKRWASSERPTRAGPWRSRRGIVEEQLTLGDLVDAVMQSAADSLEAALVIEDLVATGRVSLTSR